MGCQVVRGGNWVEVWGRDLQAMEIDMNAMPDLVPTLAVTAAFARGKTVMKRIAHLRMKESDRITSLAEELAKMGIRTEQGADWLSVEGGKAHGAEIETHNDHRLAMSFAIAGLVVPGIKIKGERCVDKSFPGFWEVLQKLYEKDCQPVALLPGRLSPERCKFSYEPCLDRIQVCRQNDGGEKGRCSTPKEVR